MKHKLQVGDIFSYKSSNFNFTAELIKITRNEDEYSDGVGYVERIISGNFLSPGRTGYSSSSEDKYITVISRKNTLENLSATAKNGDKIETKIWKKT